MLIGHDADPYFANHGAKMVRASAAHGNRPHDHQLIEMLGIRKLGDAGCRHVATIEHLVDVHLGHAASGVARVVVAYGVDDQAVKNALHLDFNLIQQQLQLTGFNKLRDIVVGVKTLAGQRQPFTNLDGNRSAFVSHILGERRSFHKHSRYYQRP